jgi:hypothetical protein
MIHNVASDAHDQRTRPPSIADELEQAGMGRLAAWLTEAVPTAILDGETIPSRPRGVAVHVEEERRPWWRRGVGIRGRASSG